MQPTRAALAATALLAMTAGGGTAATLDKEVFGTAQDGRQVERYTMTNGRGMRVQFLDLGGKLTAIDVPDRRGRLDDVVLGVRTLREYETVASANYLGSLIGRYANRIAGGKFSLDGHDCMLARNNGPNSLHGGVKGFNRQLWSVAPATAPDGVAATLSYTSPDGEEGFPGTLTIHVTYTLTNRNELRIEYRASTDKPTVVNFTNHSFFNLAGNGSGSIANQSLLVNADRYTPINASLIPTGEIAPVAGTPLDFREMTPIGARLRSGFQQMVHAHGYDHNYVLNKSAPDALSFAARLYDPASGRVLDCFTTEPGIQIYSSNSFDGSMIGSAGTVYRQGEAVTMETQHFPDSPNQPDFPTTELTPGQEFRSTTVFRFATDAALPGMTPD